MSDRPAKLASPLTALLVALVFVTLVASACSSTEPEDDTTTIADLIVDDEDDTSRVFDSSDSPTLAGVSTNPSEIEAGQCFNEYLFRDQADFLQQVTTIVGCDGPHDREAYFTREYPSGESDAYPLDAELERWAESTCLDEFENFIGLEYVLSALELGVIVPTFERWTDDGDRNVICYVYPDEGGRLLASVEGSGI